MSIHHATKTKAEAEGIAIAQDDTGITTAGEMRHASAKVALSAALLARAIESEYPAIRLAQDEDDTALILRHTETGDDIASWEDGDIPDLATVLDAAIEAGIDPEEGAEEQAPVVVVAPLYKQRYAEGGHPEHCGDWLAYSLEGAFLLPAIGKAAPAFDTDAFSSCLTDNGIELVGKWAALPTSGQPGWQGRYRMNGRQKLERQVAASGELVLHGETQPVPEDALAALRAKHPKAHQPEAKPEAEAG